VRYPILSAVAAISLVACTHSREEANAPQSMTAEPAPEANETAASAVDSTVAPEAAPESRPRLSRTVTLGESQYAPSAPPAQAQGGQSQSQSVVVNNNIVVQQTPGYAGYGGYRSYGGYGRPTTFYNNDGRSGGQRGTRQWGSSGWEGARRTAAPGQTPGVGGNWAPPPSYGPAQMK
jgi:hypothetical protein